MKRTADWLTRLIRKKGYSALSLHGDKSQTERNFVMNGQLVFRKMYFSDVVFNFIFLNYVSIVCQRQNRRINILTVYHHP